MYSICLATITSIENIRILVDMTVILLSTGALQRIYKIINMSYAFSGLGRPVIELTLLLHKLRLPKQFKDHKMQILMK